MVNADQIKFFNTYGYLTVTDLLSSEEIDYYRQVYENFLDGTIDSGSHRSDLSGLTEKGAEEKITQIMRPSLLHQPLQNSVLHQRAGVIAQQLLGDDLDLDFDMLIDKAPFKDTITPWHQDEAYWIDMDDKRALTCWVALDNVKKENGCMWYVPGSHLQALRPHQQVGNKGALECEATEGEAVAQEIQAGSCIFHHGRTIHYSRGNATDLRRRAFICNYRPAEMIAFERSQGFDHLGERDVRQ